MSVITFAVGALGMIPNVLKKSLEELEIRRRIVHPDYNIVEIGLNTPKSPGNLRICIASIIIMVINRHD